MRQRLFSLLRFRRSAIYRPLSVLLAVLLLPSISWLESGMGIAPGPLARTFQAEAVVIHSCGEPRGNLIIQQICINGSPGPVDDLNQLEADAVGAYLTAHALPASDAALIYSKGRTDLREAIRGSMLAILLGIITKAPAARTAHEQALFNWFQYAVQQNEIAEYSAALAEYQRYRNDPCGFKLDPDIASQYGLSYDGTFLCLPQTQGAGGMQVPAASYFTAVGLKNSYGKAAQTSPNFAALVTGTQINLGEMYGIAVSAGAVLGSATAAATGAFFSTIFPFALGAASPEVAVFWGGAAAASALSIGAVAAGAGTIVLLCVIVGVIAGFQVFNNQDQLNQLNNLQNLLNQARSTPPDLNAFVSDTSGLGTLKLNETLVAQTLPDVPSTAALPAHNAADLQFLITPSGSLNGAAAASFQYQDWDGIGWNAVTAGGWFDLTCLGDASGQHCPQADSFIASIHYVDWSGVKRIASRLGSNFEISKAAPDSGDVSCPADSSSGVSQAVDFSKCSSYVSSHIEYVYRGAQNSMRLSHAPAFTSSSTIYFTYGHAGTAPLTVSGLPAPGVYADASLQKANVTLTFDAAGNLVLSYQGGAAPGVYYAQLTARNAQGSVAQTFTIVLQTGLQITSPSTLTGYIGQPVNFLVTTTGYPPARLSIDPHILPDGLTFHDNGNGTATISGVPRQERALCIVNQFPDCRLVATSGTQVVAQKFAAIFNYPPQPNLLSTGVTFVAGTLNTFHVVTSGGTNPVTWLFVPFSATWLSFHDNGDGTGVLSGTPPQGSAGTYNVALIPASSRPIAGIPNFKVIVIDPAQFVTPNSTSFTVGDPASFQVFTNRPFGIVTALGNLPKGIAFAPTVNGTGIFVGVPQPGSGGSYPLQLSYQGLFSPETATQAFNLEVKEGPAFTSAATANFYAGQDNTFAVTASGYPALSSAPTAQSRTAPNYVGGMEFTVTGLPADLTYSNLNPEGYHTGTLTLSGRPSTADMGQHTVTISVNNGVGQPATQTLILNIGGSPGDVNRDGMTSCTDFKLVRSSFGRYRGQPGYNAAFDANNDGVVNIQDLSLIAKNLPAGTKCQ